MEESKSTRSYSMNVLEEINHCFLYFEEIVPMFCITVLIIAISTQIVCRYILLIFAPWVEELTRYLFAWMAYLGGGYALYTGGQIEIDIVPIIIRSLREVGVTTRNRVILLLKTIGLVITVVFPLGFCWVFGNYTMFITGKSQTPQTMHISMWTVYFPILVGSLITMWHGVYRILCNIWLVSVNTE